jgi:hypothetical protein
MASKLQKDWEEQISRAKAARKKWADEFRIKLGRDYFEGRQNPGYPEDEWISCPKVYSHVMAQVPSLYSIDPYFYVKLNKSFKPDPQAIAEMEAKGKVRQASLNYWKGELNLKAKARLGILDAFFEYGVLKVRRASDSKEHPHAGEPILDDDGKRLKGEDGKPLTYPDTLPVNERYEITRVHPCDILWDEDAGPLEDSWRWVAHHIRMLKSEALEDGQYDKAAVNSIKATKASEEDEGKGKLRAWISDKLKKKDDAEFVDIYEIYDLKKREMLAVAENADNLLIKPKPTPKGIEKHPFSFLRFTLRDSSPYPIPPVSPAIDPQKEYSLTRSRWLTHRKRFNRKYEVLDQAVADEELAKLEVGGDGTVVKVQQRGAIGPIQDAPLDQQNILEMQHLNNDMVECFGTPGAARAVADSDSATEASILDRRLEIREGDKLSMVVDWIVGLARKLDQLIQTHIDRDEAVKITGPQGEFWQTIKQEDYREIEGEFEYSVNLGASQPRLPDIERAQMIAFISQVVVPMPHVLTAPAFMKRMAELYHIEDEAVLQELMELGKKIMGGLMPMPGGQGGGPSDNPVAAVLGAAMGPSGGNANGGGAQVPS